MLRVDLEKKMAKEKMSHIVIIWEKSDKLGVLCFLKNGILMDYTDHRVDRKRNIWGWLKFDGKGGSERVAFE